MPAPIAIAPIAWKAAQLGAVAAVTFYAARCRRPEGPREEQDGDHIEAPHGHRGEHQGAHAAGLAEPAQAIRHFGVKVKHNPVSGTVAGKRVVLVDDSIVRGTTLTKMVTMMRNAGAREVHLRISSPPTIGPCYYGIDTPTREELIAQLFAAQRNPRDPTPPRVGSPLAVPRTTPMTGAIRFSVLASMSGRR